MSSSSAVMCFFMRSSTGPIENSPSTSSVTPSRSSLCERLSAISDTSECDSMLLKPGATAWPRASISRRPRAPSSGPTAVMVSPSMATSPVAGDVAIDGDTITAVGPLEGARGRREIDARGQAVAPGFSNMLSHSEVSLIADNRSQSELREGVTLEVLGEFSMGPVDERMKKHMTAEEEDIKYPIAWDTLGGYLDWLAARGLSTNVASFVGAGTVRE